MSWPVATIGENEKVFKMIEMVMGEGYLASHYFVTASVCALSPLQYAQESADTIIAYARANQPVTVLTAPMTGVSTPISDIGALVAQNAELLAGIVLAQLVQPGVPVIYGTATYAADMRSGAFITGSPLSNLIDRAALQLPNRFTICPPVPSRAIPTPRCRISKPDMRQCRTISSCSWVAPI